MNKSDQINELAKALSQLQGEIRDVYKDRQGYGYTYADLSQVLEVVRPLLVKHKLAVTQLCGTAHDKVTVETVLMHESGQWLSSTIEMGVEKGKNMSLAQAVGSVITYARRYALTAIVGFTQSDNDAAVEASDPVKSSVNAKISPAQSEHLKSLIGNDPQRLGRILSWARISRLEDMSLDTYSKALELVNKAQVKAEPDIVTLSNVADHLLDSGNKSDKIAKKLSSA